MKILMRNIGMTLHVIHTLRGRGLDNVKVNMDWQHLIMNGENLAEYAALLSAEGLMGHHHANSGWGTFDDDNMVGATAFMETLELAVELRRAGYGDDGRRLGFDLYPYTEDAVAAVRRSVAAVALHRVGRGEDRRRGAARGAVAQGRGRGVRARLRRARRLTRERPFRAPSLVTASRAARTAPGRARARGGVPSTLVGLDVGTTGVKAVAISADGEVLATDEEQYPLSTPQPGWAEQDPEDWWRAARGGARAAAVRRDPARLLGPDARARLPRRGRPRPAPGDPLERPAHGGRVRRDRGADRARAADRADRQPCADRASPRRSSSGCAATSPRCTGGSGSILLPKDYVLLRLTGEHGIDAADASGTLLFDVARRRWSDEVADALEIPREWLPPVSESTVHGGAGDQQAAALGVGVVRPGTLSVVLGTSGVVFAALPEYRAEPQARVHVFCHAVPGHVGGDGRDAERRRARCAGSATRSRPARRSRSSSPRRTSGRRARRG